MVGRFVEQQHVGAAHQRLGKSQAHPPAARKRRDRPPLVGRRKAESIKQRGRACFGRVTTDCLELGMQPGERDAVAARCGGGDARRDLPQFAIAVLRELDGRPPVGVDLLRHTCLDQAARLLVLAGIGAELAAHKRKE